MFHVHWSQIVFILVRNLTVEDTTVNPFWLMHKLQQ